MKSVQRKTSKTDGVSNVLLSGSVIGSVTSDGAKFVAKDVGGKFNTKAGAMHAVWRKHLGRSKTSAGGVRRVGPAEKKVSKPAKPAVNNDFTPTPGGQFDSGNVQTFKSREDAVKQLGVSKSTVARRIKAKTIQIAA